MKTKWESWNTGEKAELHKLASGQVWAVMTLNGNGTRDKTFNSVMEAREFFTVENGWH